MEKITKRVLQLADEKKVNLRNVAIHYKLTPDFFHRPAKGEHEWTLKSLSYIADYFKVSLDYLVYGKGVDMEYEKRIADLIQQRDEAIEALKVFRGNLRTLLKSNAVKA